MTDNTLKQNEHAYQRCNRPFPSSPGPLFQTEGRCWAFDMEIIFNSRANKTHFHKKGCAPSLILKVRVFGTRKWLIVIKHWSLMRSHCLFKRVPSFRLKERRIHIGRIDFSPDELPSGETTRYPSVFLPPSATSRLTVYTRNWLTRTLIYTCLFFLQESQSMLPSPLSSGYLQQSRVKSRSSSCTGGHNARTSPCKMCRRDCAWS